MGTGTAGRHYADGTHHAVDEDRRVRQAAVPLSVFQNQQDLLRPPDGKGRNQDPSAAGDHFADLIQQAFLRRVAVLVQAFAVGRFADHQVRLKVRPPQRRHGLLRGDAVVAREQDRAGRRLQQDHRRAQDVRRRQPADFDLADLQRLVVLDGHQGSQNRSHLMLRVQRHLGFTVGGVHQPHGIPQQDADQIDRRRRGEHRRRRTGLRQDRQPAGVVHVRVGQQNGVHPRLGQSRQVRQGTGPPIPHPAVHNEGRSGDADQRTRSANRTGAAQKRDFEGVEFGHGNLTLRLTASGLLLRRLSPLPLGCLSALVAIRSLVYHAE